MTATKTSNSSTPASESLTADQLQAMLYQMMLIRRFEQRTAQSYQQAKIGGFCHLYIGQEAAVVGAVAALQDDDPIITAYRDHGHALARGMDPRFAMAEMFGKVTGCAKGKGGSMHLFDKAHHMYGGHAIVGGQIPLGVGLAFATHYNKEDKVTMCSFGDGAINQGAFHEGMNLAAIWQLPILFVLENNAYSMGTSIARGTAGADDLSKKAASYNMRYATCDGMDVLAVYDCFKHEAGLTRQGLGPAFINVKTYRFQGHSMSDPQKYRTKDEVGQYEQQDPIKQLSSHLVEKKQCTEEQLTQLDKQAKDAAIEAIAYANESPDTPISEMFTDVYSQPFGPYQQGDLPIMFNKESSS